jgi:hypothetical protein
MENPPAQRGSVFQHICTSASLTAQQLSIHAGRTIEVSAQVKSWANT